MGLPNLSAPFMRLLSLSFVWQLAVALPAHCQEDPAVPAVEEAPATDLSEPAPATRQGEPTFTIKRFVIEGTTLFPLEVLEQRLKEFTGRKRTAADVEGARDSLEQFFHEFRRLADEPVPEQELLDTKRYVAGGYLITNQLQGSVAATLASNWLVGLPSDFLANYVPKIREVTAGQVQEIAKKYFDPKDQSIVVVGDGKAIDLGPTEFRLLHFFMTHAERVHSRTQLLDQVWGDHVFVEERTVDVHIRRLRSALEATGHDRLIQTVRGSGYRCSAQVE